MFVFVLLFWALLLASIPVGLFALVKKFVMNYQYDILSIVVPSFDFIARAELVQVTK